MNILKYKILIIDDELSGRMAMKILLDKIFWAYTEKLDFANTFEDAQLKFSSAIYDIIFLDINLKGVSAFDLLSSISGNAKVIFVTAYSEFMLKALRNKAFDYLMKPVKEIELAECLDRIKSETSIDNAKSSIQIKSQGVTRIIHLSEIIYIEGDGPYATLFLNNESIKTAKTIKSLILILNENFVRIHKSFLVNKNYIKGFNMDKLILHNKQCLPVSRTGYKNLST